MTDEGKEREETLRALMEMAWSVGFERVPIPPEKAGEARAILREHDARIWEQAAKVCEEIAEQYAGSSGRRDFWLGEGASECATALRARAQGGKETT